MNYRTGTAWAVVMLVTTLATAPDANANLLGIYEFTGDPNAATQSHEVTQQPESGTFSTFTRQDLVWHQAPDVFNSRDWNLTDTLDLNTHYITFSFTVNSGYSVPLTSLQFLYRGVNNTPSNARVAYSTDGFATVGDFLDLPPMTATVEHFAQWDFDAPIVLNEDQTITFRWYVWGTTSVSGGTSASNGTFRVDDVALFTPEPGSLALLGLGLMAMAQRRRRG